MKKLLLLSVLTITLVGCGSTPETPAEEAQKIAQGEHVSTEIKRLQLQLERGEVTKKYASEKLKQILKERQRQNSGDTEVILEKIKAEDPMLEKGLAEMIKRRNAEEATSQE